LVTRPGQKAHWRVQTDVDVRERERERETERETERDRDSDRERGGLLSLTMKYTNISLTTDS
jgi:hypothetical protein